ncbi:MAG: hypothetical protein IKK67_10400, partial [Bacteroidaceae bacterium]|nr:hypothetical protein [Bacteroidaceae bacterium]
PPPTPPQGRGVDTLEEKGPPIIDYRLTTDISLPSLVEGQGGGSNLLLTTDISLSSLLEE